MRTIRTLLTAACLAVVLTACGGGSSSDDAARDGAGDAAGASGDAVGVVARVAAAGDLPTVELLAPGATAAGAYPRFRWSAVDGADLYRIAVLDESGPVWAWEVDTTEVRLGGIEDEPSEGYGGIRLEGPAWWSVTAITEAGEIVAMSDLRAVSPDDEAPTWRPGEAAATSGAEVSGGEAPSEDAGDSDEPRTACDLLTEDEVRGFLGGDISESSSSDAQDGDYQSCEWTLATDEFTSLVVSVSRIEGAWDPTGWVRDEPVPVEGLGEESFATMDFGLRVGFLRDGATVYVIGYGTGGEKLPSAIELARLIDSRLSS